MLIYNNLYENINLNNTKLTTAINKNPLNPDDKYIYRPVGFKGNINFIDSNNVLIKGRFVFDGWFYGQSGTLFIEVKLGDQVLSMIPIEQNEVTTDEWLQSKTDALWFCDINLKINIESSIIFNQNTNQNVLFSIGLKINEKAFISNIGIMYDEATYLQFIDDVKTNIFQTKFKFKNTYNIFDNSEINLFQGVEIDAVNKPDEINLLHEKNREISTPVKISFPDMYNTRIIDFLFRLEGINNLDVVLKKLKYEIVKYQKSEIATYSFESDDSLNEQISGDSIIVKNKLKYEYNPVTSKFEARISEVSNFILELNQKTTLKGTAVLNINGFFYYFKFEKNTLPLSHKPQFEVQSV